MKIQFKGKRLDNGEEVVGSLLQYPSGHCVMAVFEGKTIRYVDVEPESVEIYENNRLN